MKEQSDEHYQFRPGWALIINGGPESGKERLARKIAINHGRYREMQASALDKRDGISAMTALDCETVIIHGIPAQHRPNVMSFAAQVHSGAASAVPVAEV